MQQSQTAGQKLFLYSAELTFFSDFYNSFPNLTPQVLINVNLPGFSKRDRDRAIELTARLFGISKEQVETLLHQPHGLKRLLNGKIYTPVQADAAHKRAVALELAVLISEHLIKNGGKFEDVYPA